MMGLYLGIGPTITRSLLHLNAPTMAGLAILALTVSGGITNLMTYRMETRHVLFIGSGALVVASGGIVIAVLSANVAVFFIASVIAGIGFGGCFQSGMRTLMSRLRSDQRGGTLSAMYLISYVAFGVPTLIGGLLIPTIGLQQVVVAYACLLVMLAAGSAFFGRNVDVVDKSRLDQGSELNDSRRIKT
jgi:MFS family permease